MRKRFLRASVLSIFAVTSIAAATAVSFGDDVDEESFIKVGIAYGSSAPDAVTVSAEAGLALCSTYGDELTKSDDVLDDVTSVTLKKSSQGVAVCDDSGEVLAVLKGDGSECIASKDYFSSNDYVEYKGDAYRGSIMPYINSNGQMNIINYLNIEDYVKGVLDSEMGHGSNIEALKAQAVTARSFAAANGSKHASQGFSVCTTSHCQVYSGVSGEYERTNQAVDETRGQLMYYNGEPVAGYYSANSGGHTENVEDVWGGEALGYLRGKEDVFSPELNWTVELTKSQLNSALSEKIGDVRSVTVDSVNDSGYVASITITGSKSSITVIRDSIRSAFGPAASLKSRLFTISKKGTGAYAGRISALSEPSGQEESVDDGSGMQTSDAAGPEGSYYALGSGSVSILSDSLYALSSLGAAQADLNGMNILDGDGRMIKAELQTAEPSADPDTQDDPYQDDPSDTNGGTVYLSDSGDVLVISGRGYGHGVGMAQQGAQQMGNQGYSYIDILNYYYTDIEIK